MKSLYHISKEALDLAELLEVEELTPELEERLAINQNELQEKSVNFGFVIKDAENSILVIDEEIKRLQAIKKTQQKKCDILKGKISDALQFYGIEKVETPTIKMSFRRSESVEIVSLEQLQGEYLVEKVSVTADKKAIKQAIKEGKEVDGAIIKENFNLQIK
jgi:hypothetical protein